MQVQELVQVVRQEKVLVQVQVESQEGQEAQVQGDWQVLVQVVGQEAVQVLVQVALLLLSQV